MEEVCPKYNFERMNIQEKLCATPGKVAVISVAYGCFGSDVCYLFPDKRKSHLLSVGDIVRIRREEDLCFDFHISFAEPRKEYDPACSYGFVIKVRDKEFYLPFIEKGSSSLLITVHEGVKVNVGSLSMEKGETYLDYYSENMEIGEEITVRVAEMTQCSVPTRCRKVSMAK